MGPTQAAADLTIAAAPEASRMVDICVCVGEVVGGAHWFRTSVPIAPILLQFL